MGTGMGGPLFCVGWAEGGAPLVEEDKANKEDNPVLSISSTDDLEEG